MKIHLNGFSVADVCPHFSLADFRDTVPKYSQFDLYGRHRVLTYGTKGNYFVGLLASSTDQDKDVVLVIDANGEPHFKIHDTSSLGARQAFNFFAINATTGMGLLSRYFGGGSVSAFGRVLRSQYLIHKRLFREKYIHEHLGDDDFNEGKERKKFSVGEFVVKPVFRKGTFEELLKTLNVITELMYDEPNVKEPKYSTVRDQLRLDRRLLKFDVTDPKKPKVWRNLSRPRIVQFIKDTIIERGVDVATVHGKNSAGKDMPPVTISPEVDSFGEYRYNDVVVAANLRVANVASSPFIGEIVEVAHANAGLFETTIA